MVVVIEKIFKLHETVAEISPNVFGSWRKFLLMVTDMVL